MPKKYLIVLFFMAFVGAGHAVPLQGLPLLSDTAFAQLQEDGQPCPPECVTDSMEIVTWYPSPYNEYEELRLYPVQRDDNYCDNAKIGLMYYDDGGTPSFGDDDKMRVCKGTELGWQEVGGGFWQQSLGSNISNTNSGNVGIGTANPSAGGEQDLKLDVEGAIGAKFYCDENGNNCSSAPLSSIVSVQSNKPFSTSFSANMYDGSVTPIDVISLSIDTTGSNILASVTCGWTRRGGSYQAVLAGRLLLDGGSDVILPDIGGVVYNQTLEQAMYGGGQALFTGMAPGSSHTITYRITAKFPWSIPGPSYDIFTTDSDHCRMILLSY